MSHKKSTQPLPSNTSFVDPSNSIKEKKSNNGKAMKSPKPTSTNVSSIGGTGNEIGVSNFEKSSTDIKNKGKKSDIFSNDIYIENINFLINKYDTMDNFAYHLRNLKRLVSEYMIQVLKKISITKSMKNVKSVSDKLYRSDLLFHCENIKHVLNNMKDEIISLETYHIIYQVSICDIFRCTLKIKIIIHENEWMKKLTKLLSQKLEILTNYLSIATAEIKANKTYYKLRQYCEVTELGYSIDFDNDVDIPSPKEYVPVLTEAIFGLSLEHIQHRQYDVLKSFVEDKISNFKLTGNDDSLEIALLYTILGAVYEEQNMHNEAYEYYFRTLEIRQKLLESDHDAIGVTLTRLANIEFKRLSYNKAADKAQLALEIREIHLKRFDVELGDLNALIGNIYYHLNHWNYCIYYTKRALDIYLLSLEKHDYEVIKCYLRITKSHIVLKDFPKSIQILTLICDDYHEMYMKSKKLEYSNIFVKINDSVKNNTTAKVIDQLIDAYGKVTNVLDRRIFDLIIEFYITSNQPNVVKFLNNWRDYEDIINPPEKVNKLQKKDFSQLSSIWSFYKEKISKDDSKISTKEDVTISAPSKSSMKRKRRFSADE